MRSSRATRTPLAVPLCHSAYYGDLLAFARYANTHGLNILHASKADVAGFKALLEDPDADGLSPALLAELQRRQSEAPERLQKISALIDTDRTARLDHAIRTRTMPRAVAEAISPLGRRQDQPEQHRNTWDRRVGHALQHHAAHKHHASNRSSHRHNGSNVADRRSEGKTCRNRLSPYPSGPLGLWGWMDRLEPVNVFIASREVGCFGALGGVFCRVSGVCCQYVSYWGFGLQEGRSNVYVAGWQGACLCEDRWQITLEASSRPPPLRLAHNPFNALIVKVGTHSIERAADSIRAGLTRPGYGWGRSSLPTGGAGQGWLCRHSLGLLSTKALYRTMSLLK